MKKITFLRNLIVLVALLIGSGSAMGQTTDNLACTAGTIVSNTMTFTTTNFTIVHSKGTDANFASYTPWRVYTGNTVTFTGNANVGTITSIVITAGSEAYATAAVGGTLTVLTGTGSVSGSANGLTATITMTGDVKEFRLKPSAQTRWSSVQINYTYATPDYEITPASNNESFGTVSLAGNIITATPAAGYRVNTTTPYQVISGSATVVQNGNEFTVTPSENCTVQINFEAIPAYTVSFNSGSGTYEGSSLTESIGGAGVVLAAAVSCNAQWTFAGWAAASVVETATAPTLYVAGNTYYPTANVTLYAVYSKSEEGSGINTSSYGFEDGDTGWTSEATKSDLNPKTGIYSGRIASSPVYTSFESVVASPLSFTFSLMRTSNNINYDIQVQTSTDNSNWTTRATYPMSDFANGSYTEKTTDLSAYSNVYVRLYYNGTTAVRHIDDISITYSGGITTIYNSNPDCTANPFITVTETTIPAMEVTVGSVDTETITVSGANLEGNITLALSGDNADYFDLSTLSIVAADGTVTDVIVTITYAPEVAGSHTATLTLSSANATDVTRILSGTATWAPIDAPEALPADKTQTSYTAKWNAVDGATEYELSVFKKEGGVVVPDLFISEYIEGSGNNKAIEIYNGTGTTVDLSAYSLKKQTNGAGDYTAESVLSGILTNNDVYILANTGANTTILALADVTNSTSMNFNGNDAVALFKNGVLIDEVGVFNQVDNWGVDVTLIRKSSVTGPKATYDVADWDSYSVDYTSNLGSHTIAGGVTLTEILGSPFTVVGTSRSFSGLNEGGTFVYTVKAKNANVTSAASNEIEVEVAGISVGTDNPSLTSIYAHNANIHFTAMAGEKVEVYNAVGQKIISTLATDGQNELPVNAKGVMIVKIGSRLAKVIL